MKKYEFYNGDPHGLAATPEIEADGYSYADNRIAFWTGTESSPSIIAEFAVMGFWYVRVSEGNT